MAVHDGTPSRIRAQGGHVSEVRVARLDELQPGEPKAVEVEGTPIVLARVGESVYACGDMCMHQGGPLSEGKLSGTKLTCPWHGGMYDVRSGQCLIPSRGGPVRSYPVRIDGDDVWITM